MYPTVKDGDVLIVNRFQKPSYDDIVTVYCDTLDKVLLKRVIGLEGDKIEIKDGIVYRNGEKLEENYNEDDYTDLSCVVGENGIFVMGDNRNNSTDSRDLGTLNINNVRGVCVLDTGWNKGYFMFCCIVTLSVGWFMVATNSTRQRNCKKF